MSVRTWLIGVGWLLDVELSMVMMSPQSDKDIGIRPRNQSRNVALYKHFEKGAVLRYPLGLCPRHSGRYRRGVSALPAPASAPGHPEGERPPKTPTDAHKAAESLTRIGVAHQNVGGFDR
jgi:hypothetical protein